MSIRLTKETPPLNFSHGLLSVTVGLKETRVSNNSQKVQKMNISLDFYIFSPRYMPTDETSAKIEV